MRTLGLAAILGTAMSVCQATGTLAAAPYFKIKVVDDQTGRGVPLVELTTVHHVSHITDSNGLIAFYEPGLMNQRVFFYVRSDGYEYPKDGFGFRGVALQTDENTAAEIKIRRLNLAERLYRITGAGIYRDSLLLGESVPIRQPLINAQVLGQDSVMAVAWRDRLWWFWGDTNRPRYPLGQFHMSGATSLAPGQGGLDPAVGIDLEYFADREGFSRPMCPVDIPKPVWIRGIAVVLDESGRPCLVGHYALMKSLGEVIEHGLAVFDEKTERFVRRVQFDVHRPWQCPLDQALEIRDGDQTYLAFTSPYAIVRVKPTLKNMSDPSQYESFTCLEPGSRYDALKPRVEHDRAGRTVYGWKRSTDPITPAEERKLIVARAILPDEAFFQPQDLDTREAIELHRGTIAWNEFRGKWILIAVQTGGKSSFLGEVWYSEADSPIGPWRWARKIVTHNKYTFYNPVHHTFFDQQNGRIIYFEGTYANTFSGNPSFTPRYDYNQIMYRLDLANPRLSRPLPP